MSNKSQGKILKWPERPPAALGFQAVKSTYTVREISQLFGLSEHWIRRWTREGVIQPLETADQNKLLFEFRALAKFRRVREMKAAGKTLSEIDAELRGQMNLFQTAEGRVLDFAPKRGPFEEALWLHEQGNDRAVESYEHAIAEGDYVADAYCNLGILEFDAGHNSKALDCFTRSLKEEPRHFESHFNLANLYFDAGDLALARLHYEFAGNIEPSFAQVHFHLGLVHALQGDFSASREELMTCKELSAEDESRAVDDLLKKLERVMETE
ncbi:MAG: hypothetical protein DMF61_13940 [Blastocatellia bacterium AA13]|nr:MAG: hypothetical protein DMF61_13940 [Blastocatellia bacterium AA13]